VISGLPSQSSGVAGEPSRVRGASVTFGAGGPHPLAYASTRSDVDCYIGVSGRSATADPSRRFGPVVSSGLRLTRTTGTGPAPTTAMMHIALQEAFDGKVIEWMEKVSEEEYQRS
jgi:hypothetical protein